MSEMTQNLIMQDKRLRPLYQQYLRQVKPHLVVKALDFYQKKPKFDSKLCAVLLVPRYCNEFAFESLFIGHQGCNVHAIREECGDDVMVKIEPYKD